MTFLPTCLDHRPATYVPGKGYVCGPDRAPMLSADALMALVKRGWCRGAGGYARCPWLIQELGDDSGSA